MTKTMSRKEMRLSEKLVRKAVSKDDPWRLGNQVLYDLCRDYPHHTNPEEIVAKVWLIGRAYSASVERGRGKAETAALSNDRFYVEAVPKALTACGLDGRLRRLSRMKSDNRSWSGAVLETHACLVKAFNALTTKDKRSLASKYLHFHLPNAFYIYDSRAASSIRKLGLRSRNDPASTNGDREYARFVDCASQLRDRVEGQFDVRLTPRQLDRLLLAIEARKA